MVPHPTAIARVLRRPSQSRRAEVVRMPQGSRRKKKVALPRLLDGDTGLLLSQAFVKTGAGTRGRRNSRRRASKKIFTDGWGSTV